MKHRFSSPEELLNEYELGKKPCCQRFRNSSILTRRSSSMSRGKLYLTEENKSYSVLTNYPTVNYLNLEEYVYYCEYQVPPDYIRWNPNQNPHIEDQLLRHYFEDYRLTFLKEMAWLRDKFCSVIEHEKYVAASLSLLKRRDVSTYRDLLAKCVDGHSRRPWVDRGWLAGYSVFEICKMLLQIVIACCEDSSVIAEAMLEISEHSGAVGLSEKLLLMCHVQRANLDISQFDENIHLLDVLSHALREGNLEIMKLGLELELSSGYSINPVWIMFEEIRRTFSWFCGSWVKPKFWPRKKDGLRSESFYSVEFYAAFTHITCYAALKTLFNFEAYRGHRQNIVRCFKLLWRAVPTPYLPIEDMQRSVNFGAIRRYSASSGNMDEHAFWSEAVAELFEDDFPTEFKPRTLKHLSRHAARQLFRSSEQISSLPLPSSLKRYLMLET